MNYTEYKRYLRNFGKKLLDTDEVFTDRLGNPLNRGNMICYVQGASGLKIGVFVGLVERYTGSLIYDAEAYFFNNDKPNPSIVPEKQICFSILDRKDRVRFYYIPLKKIVDNKLLNMIVVQTPEFRVGEEGIAKCLALIDDLKDGILKNVDLDDGDEEC